MPFGPDAQVLAERTYKYAPPPWRMYDALTSEVEHWVLLRPREVMPVVVDAVRSELVVWGSLWPVSPDDRIGFVIAAEGQGSTVRFAWVTPAPPDDRGVNIVRHRLNQLIGGDLRSWVDTQRATLSP